MAASSDELRALQASNENLQRSVDRLADAIAKMAAGATPGGAQAPSAGALPAQPGAPPGQGFWASKSGDAVGVGTGLMQQFISSGGAGSAAGIMGGLATGVPGLLNAGAQIAGATLAEVVRPGIAAAQAGHEALATGSPFASEDFLNQRAKLVENLKRAEEEDTRLRAGAAAIGRAPGFFSSVMKKLGSTDLDEYEREYDLERQGAARRRRVAAGELEKFDSARDAVRRTDAFFSPFVDLGRQPTEDEIERVGKIAIKQAERHHRLERDVESVITQIQADSPGYHGQQAKR